MRALFMILIWLFCGFIAMLLLYIPELRGKKFDTSYFDYFGEACLTFFCSGVIGLCIMLTVTIGKFISNRKFCLLKKLIYKIANIGVKKTTQDKYKNLTN